ncbi:MAG: tyrosine--tRNA ligase [Erysipelotrichaceae bacterium]|nr:tyrosine--tRNA ligase [Erysipelotrichaceae bacterium]
MKRDLFTELKERGFVYQMNAPEEVIKAKLNGEPMTFYLGIDPTADSIHLGTLVSAMFFRLLQKHGHKGLLLLGGATGQIGDPSGRNDMRKMMGKDWTKNNVEGIKKVISNIIDFSEENGCKIVNNADWMNDISYIDFLRTVGTHFNVNTMLSAEAYAKRLENGGLTFLEMGYMLIQANDFVHLHDEYGCTFQIGGSDQWGNILAGSTLYKKMYGEEKEPIYCLTCPLLLNAEGNKMGKSANGTIWLSKEKTSPFDMYQYLYNVDDRDVEGLLKRLTDLDLDEIEEIMKGDILVAKRKMAYEIVKLIHGQEDADKVLEAVDALFKGKTNLDNVPVFDYPLNELKKGINVLELCVISRFIESKSEARRLVLAGGLSCNDQKITDLNASLTEKDLVDNEYVLLKKGKKNFLKVNFK